MKRLALMVVLAAACGGSGEDQVAADTTFVEPDLAVELEMPEAPSASRGRIAMRSAGPVGLDGEWSARAGRCVSPPMLQVLLEEEYDGMILLLALPRSGSRVTTYPVFTANSDTAGIPEGPVSQAGVQRIIESRPYAWQAESGQVDLYAWEGDRVSARFALTLRNIATNERSKVAGSFLGVEALELGLEQCQPTAPPPGN